MSAAAPKVTPLSTRQGNPAAEGDPESGQIVRRRWTAGQRDAVRNYFSEETKPK